MFKYTHEKRFKCAARRDAKISHLEVRWVYAPMLVYIFSTAFSLVVINQFEMNISPSFVAFASFFLCIIFFNVINFNRIRLSHSILFHGPFDFIIINVITTMIWLGTFWGLKYISPGIFVSIFMSMIPLSSVLIALSKDKFYNKITLGVMVFLLIMLGIILHARLVFMGISESSVCGFVCAVLAGFFSSVYINYSEKLQKKFNLKAIDLLCIRFYFLIIVCFCLFLLFEPGFNFAYYLSRWYDFIIIAALTSIIPLYSLQKSIQNIGAMQVSCIIALTPVAVYFLQLCFSFQFNITVFVMILTMSLVLIQYYRLFIPKIQS